MLAHPLQERATIELTVEIFHLNRREADGFGFISHESDVPSRL